MTSPDADMLDVSATVTAPEQAVADPDLAVRSAVVARRAAFLDDLADWLRIPSVSGDRARTEDVGRSAEWLAAALRRTGFPTVEIWDAPGGGLPAVFADWPSGDPDAPTVVVYGHHDVQPVDPPELWHSPAFEPVLRTGDDGVERLYARGAADDKGQVLFHTLGLSAHLEATGRSAPAVNLKMLVEGEEESGSPNFAALLRAHRDRLACDVVVVSDTGIWARDVPTSCTAMRGLVGCEVHLHGPDSDLHSGSFGGAVPNPVTALARIIGALHDERGRVTIPGFYDRVRPLSDTERDLIARLPFDEAEFLRSAESRAAHGEAGFSTLERIWARPTAEVNGMYGGYAGPGGKTIVPTDAYAKLSFRLVADQDPAEVMAAFDAWLAERVPDGLTLTVEWEGNGVRPCLTPLGHPALQAVLGALSRAFGKRALVTREGGSGPEADLAEILSAPVVFLGVGLDDDHIHAPNEKVDVDLLLRGAEAAAYLWQSLPEALRTDVRATE